MSLYDQYETSKDLEREGVILELGTNKSDGTTIGIRIARAGGGNIRFTKTVEQRLKPHRHAIQTKTMDREMLDRIMMEVYADTVILGWENVRNRDGSDKPFNREEVLELLTDLPDLWKQIQSMSDDISVFREMERKADAGN